MAVCPSLSAQVTHDTIYVSKSQLLLFDDSLFVPVSDTLVSYPDSVRVRLRRNPYYKSDVFYDSLRAKAYRNRITRELHKLLIRDHVRDVYESKTATKSESYFTSQEGRNITRIQVVRVPVLEGRVLDTTLREPQSTLGKIANSIHVPTVRSLIKRNLLFEEGDSVNPYELADSERIIRNLPYIEDARIYLLRDLDDSSKVTATIVIKDRFNWSLDGAFIDFSNYNVRLVNSNVLGTGNRLSGRYIYRRDRIHEHGYDFRFLSQNIGNSFARIEAISARNYRQDQLQFRLYQDFLSPKIKYGGELIMGRSTDEIPPPSDTLDLPPQYATQYYHDLWAGHSFNVNPDNQRQQLILGGRFLTKQYSQRPEVLPDSNEYYFNRNIILATAFYQKINYIKARNVLAYGITEDIPIGHIFSVLGGPETNEFERRLILGSKAGFARFSNRWGYLGLINQTEVYLDHGFGENFYMKTQANYFSPVYPLGRSDLRHFLTLKHNYGQNISPPRTVGIGQDIRGVREQLFNGHATFSGRLETVIFLPYFFYGFRFAPFTYFDFAFVNREQQNAELLGTIGAGLRLRNESFVVQSVELGIYYAPREFTEGQRIITINLSTSVQSIFRFLIPVKPNLLYEY